MGPHVIKKQNKIISAVASRVQVKNVKYGMRIPTSIKEAYEIDMENGNTLWRDAIKREMENASVAFEILEDGKRQSASHKKVPFHMIYDIKMDFTRKARLVAEGCSNLNPVTSTYSGVVSRESVRIAFTYAALNGLDVWAADVHNTFLQAPCSEKYYTVCGAEFGSEFIGKLAILFRGDYGLKSAGDGLKSAGDGFRNHLRECMEHLLYES